MNAHQRRVARRRAKRVSDVQPCYIAFVHPESTLVDELRGRRAESWRQMRDWLEAPTWPILIGVDLACKDDVGAKVFGHREGELFVIDRFRYF